MSSLFEFTYISTFAGVSDMAEDTTTGAEEEGADLADEGRIKTPEGRENYCTSEECKWLAWRLYAEGQFAFKPLSRAVNERQHPNHENCPAGPHGNHWAERAIDYCGRATRAALDRGGDVSLAILLQGYQADLQAQLVIAAGGADESLRSLARTRVTDIREKQAAAIGVVTERKGLEVSGGIWWEGIDAAQSAAEDNGSEPAE